jgi:hypothetical protein
MRHSDWQLIYQRVSEIDDPADWPTNLGWASIGTSAAAFLTLLGWLGTYFSLPSDQQARLIWVAPVIGVIFLLTGVLGVVCFMFARGTRQRLQRDKDHILEDMNHFYAPHRTHTPPQQ